VELSYTMRTNDAAVSANRTFVPIGYVQDVAKWQDTSGGIQVGYPHFELSVRPPVNGSKVNRVTLTVSLPTLEQTSASTASGIQPAPMKAYDCFFKGEFLLPERSARWERVALLNTVISLLCSTLNASDDSPSTASGSPVKAAILDFERPY